MLRKILLKLAFKIIKKYSAAPIDVKTKLYVDNTLYHISTISINKHTFDYSTIRIEGIEAISKLKDWQIKK